MVLYWYYKALLWVYNCSVQVVSMCEPNSIIEEEEILYEIYPNPAQDLIFSNTPLSGVIIYNFNGVKLLKKSKINSELGINVNSFSKGVYFLEGLNIKGEKVLKRFIK